MANVIDRRKIRLSTTVSVDRYIKKYRRGESMEQPLFYYDANNSGVHDFVTVGNDNWVRGDQIIPTWDDVEHRGS